MTLREACLLLGVNQRQTHYLLTQAGVPQGYRRRTVNGTLTEPARQAVLAIAERRRQPQPGGLRQEVGEALAGYDFVLEEMRRDLEELRRRVERLEPQPVMTAAQVAIRQWTGLMGR